MNGWLNAGRFVVYLLTILLGVSAVFFRLEGRVALCEQTSQKNEEAVRLMNRELSDIKSGIARIEAILEERQK